MQEGIPVDGLIFIKAVWSMLVKGMFVFQRNLSIFLKVGTKDAKKLLKIFHFLNTTTVHFFPVQINFFTL